MARPIGSKPKKPTVVLTVSSNVNGAVILSTAGTTASQGRVLEAGGAAWSNGGTPQTWTGIPPNLVQQTYTTPGTYTIQATVTVRDNRGASGNKTISVPVSVDQTPVAAPTCQFITRASTNPSTSQSVLWNVVFSIPVTGVTTGAFSLVNGGLTGPSITSVVGSGTAYTVAADRGTGTGTLGLNLTVAAGIVGTNLVPFTAVPVVGAVYTMATIPTPPTPTPLTIDSLTRVDASPTQAPATVRWLATFSEAVSGVTLNNFTLTATGGTTGAALSSISGTGATRTISATTGSQTTQGTLRLNLASTALIVAVSSGVPLSGGLAGEVYTVNPPPPVPTPEPSALCDPAPPALSVVDASSNTWTLGGSAGPGYFYILRNGVNVGGGLGSLIKRGSDGAIWVLGGDSLWYRFNSTANAYDLPGVVPDPCATPVIPPTAEDFGNFRPQVQGQYSQVTGGRGGSLYRVTKTTMDGSVGSLNWACSQSNGVVVFDTNGPFILTSSISLNISGSNLTIAGQTAPGQGVFIIYQGSWGGYTDAVVTGSNVIVQHVTVCGGNICSQGLLVQGNHIILDHVTQLWHQDEGLMSYQGSHHLYWRCLNSEGLNQTPEAGGCAQGGASDVSHGMLIYSSIDDITIAQSAIVSNFYRNPLIIGATTTRLVNVLVYNWLYRAVHYQNQISGSPGNTAADRWLTSLVGCRFIPGPGNTQSYPLCVAFEGDYYGTAAGANQAYLSDCTYETNGYLTPQLQGSSLGYSPMTGTPPVSLTGYIPQPSATLEAFLLPKVGARPGAAYRNTLTCTRILTYITNRLGPRPGTGSDVFPVYSSDVGGPPSITTSTGTYADPSSPNTVVGPYGRTNRDHYLESLAIAVES